MEKIKGDGNMEKQIIYKKLKCPKCKGKLFSIYFRGFGKFKSLEGFYYCKKCDVVIKLQEEPKQNI